MIYINCYGNVFFMIERLYRVGEKKYSVRLKLFIKSILCFSLK